MIKLTTDRWVSYPRSKIYERQIEKVKKVPDKGETFGNISTDLSKALGRMTHDLLKAKLHALNFNMNPLHMTFDYLKGRKQWVKIESSFSAYLDLFQGIPLDQF